jgi:diguanylate cyclase (GGDEF)-like protein
MNLDLPTLMVMQSFALGCAGAVLLVIWSQQQKTPSLALWGVANVIAATGILSMMFGVTLRQPAWPIIGGILMVFQSGLMWKAARTFASKSAPLVVVFLGPAVVGLANVVPAFQGGVGAALSLIVGAGYFLAAATAFWLDRKEQLAARRPLIGLTIVQAGFYLIGACSTLSGATSQDGVPSIMSLYGLIYFESIVFALGSSVFIFALVKERSEAASMTAARTDSLTGIANRAAFLENAGRILERCRRDRAPVSVMTFDLDRFKAVNDRYGHAIGDAVIRKFCETVTAALRPNDVFGRMGGEEFAVVLPGSSIQAACARAERIRDSFAEDCRFVRNHQVNATVSGGVSVSVNAEETLDELLEYSDVALYSAKTEGRNRINRADQPKTEGGSSNVFRVA